MRVCLLEGSWEEMGETWGRVLRERSDAKEAILYFLNEPKRLSMHLFPASRLKRVFASLFLKLLLRWISRRVREEDKAFLKAFSRALGVPERDLVSAFSAPDFFNLLLSVTGRLAGTQIPHVPIGCTSFVVLGSATKKGVLFHGRNLDYGGGLFWEGRHTALVLRPKSGFASVSLVADGLYIPGVTGINEEGLCISLNLCFSRDAKPFGIPVLSLVSEIISKASSIRDVADILRKKRPLSGWAITVSSARENDAAVFELSSSGFSILHPESGVLVFTNMFFSEEKRISEFAPSYAWVENNWARFKRAKSFLIERKGRLEERDLLDLLADGFDPDLGKKVSFGNTVANAATISSALFCFEESFLWAAEGKAPVSRDRFLKLSLDALFSGRLEILDEYRPDAVSPEESEALRFFIEACYLWEDMGNVDRILHLLDLAVSRKREPLFLLVRALFLLKLESFDEALDDLMEAASGDLTAYKRAVIWLWIGRVWDLKGRRTEAFYWYEKAFRSGFFDVMLKAKRGMERPYSLRELRGLDIVMFLADFVDPVI